MRTNTSKVIAAFDAGKAYGNGAIWTDGSSIYSYGTAIVVRLPSGLAINVTKYSTTTSNHQNALYAALLPRIVAHLNERPRAISASELRSDAREVLALADVVAQEVAL